MSGIRNTQWMFWFCTDYAIQTGASLNWTTPSLYTSNDVNNTKAHHVFNN